MSPVRRSSLVALALLAAAPGAAHAAQGPIPSAPVADGSVLALALDGQGRAYAGGSFTRIGPRYGHGIALTTASSTPASGFPDINGPVYASISDGAGGWFIGGAFNSVGGVTRNQIAHINADNTLDTSWNPGANNSVRSLVLAGSTLYAGGDFTQMGASVHIRLAKIDASTGTVDAAWQAASSSRVNALAVIGANLYAGGSGIVGGGIPALSRFTATGTGDSDPTFNISLDGPVGSLAASGTTLYAGGAFFDAGFGAADHPGLAKIDTTVVSPGDPVDNAWDPETFPAGPEGVSALLLVGGDLIIGGQITAVDGAPRIGIAKLSAGGTGLLDAGWHPDTDSAEVRALALSGDDVIVGGTYPGLGGQSHASLGKVSMTTGAASATWNPNPGATVNTLAFSGSTLFAGGTFVSAGPLNVERNGLARFNPDGTLDTSWNPNVAGAVNAVALSGTDLYIGGSFSYVGGTPQPVLAKLSTETAALDATWNPGVSGPEVSALALSAGDLFFGGSFTQVDGASRLNLAKVSASGTALLDMTWNPAPLSQVHALAVSGGSLFLGGAFGFLNTEGVVRNRIAKLSTSGAGVADPTWDPAANGAVWSLALSGSDLFVGGQFTAIGGQSRSRIAKLSTTGAGAADTTWNPGITGGNAVFALAVDGDHLLAGGNFTGVGGKSRAGLARLAATGTGAADDRLIPPVSDGAVTSLAPAATRLWVGGLFTALGSNSISGLGFYDLTAPSSSVTVPAEGGRYPQGASVAAAYSCADPDGAANVASCTGPVASGAGFDTSVAGPHSFAVTATDAGGDTATATVNYVVDASDPSITVTTPAAGAVYAQSQVVTADYSCSDKDGAADVSSCAGPVASGAAIDTATAGIHNFAVSSQDVSGNTASRTVTYVVSAAPSLADTTAPTIAGFKVRPKRFKAKAGARVSFVLSEAASVKVSVLQIRKGKKPKRLGGFTVKGKAGANRVKFTGRVAGKTLKPGSYRLSARATDAAKNRSEPATANFTIVRR